MADVPSLDELQQIFRMLPQRIAPGAWSWVGQIGGEVVLTAIAQDKMFIRYQEHLYRQEHDGSIYHCCCPVVGEELL